MPAGVLHHASGCREEQVGQVVSVGYYAECSAAVWSHMHGLSQGMAPSMHCVEVFQQVLCSSHRSVLSVLYPATQQSRSLKE